MINDTAWIASMPSTIKSRFCPYLRETLLFQSCASLVCGRATWLWEPLFVRFD